MQPSARIKINVGGSLSTVSQTLAAFASQTRIIRVAVSQPAFIKVGEAGNVPTADATGGSPLMVPGIDYLTVSPGQKFAILGTASLGSFSVTEMD